MKVFLGTFEVTDEMRRVIRLQKEEVGLAIGKEVKDYILDLIQEHLEDLVLGYDK